MSAAPRLRATHAALAGSFLAFGVLDGTWAARLPALERGLRLDSGELGLVILSVSLAATACLPVSGRLVSRRGSRTPLAAGLALAASALAAAAFAPSLPLLVPAAVALGVGFSVVDVAANAHGVALERRVGRPLLSVLHGAWSGGLLAGSGIAAVAAAAAAGLRLQFPLVAGCVVVAAVLLAPRLLPAGADAIAGARLALPRGPLALPAAVAFCSMFVESAAMNWSAVFLAGPARSGSAVAAVGVVAFSVAMALARLAGDRLTVRWGVSGLARRGGVLTCAGVALALATRSPAPAVVGFAVVGAGCAALVPAVFRLAGSVPGVAAGAGIAAVATAGYIGGVVNGPAIGFLARAVGLTGALSLLGVAGLGIALLGTRLGSRA